MSIQRYQCGMLVNVSTANVSKETADRLNAWALQNADALRTNDETCVTAEFTIWGSMFGWLVPTWPIAPTTQPQIDLPDDLRQVLTRALELGFDYVLFDRDADPLEDLPFYDW